MQTARDSKKHRGSHRTLNRTGPIALMPIGLTNIGWPLASDRFTRLVVIAGARVGAGFIQNLA